MADIFLSYAREDRHKAELLSRALEHAGWSVWWDREILPGASYERLIEAELSAAHCVVVLWSASARQSNWVRDEATLAISRHVLVSVLLDDAEPPLGFRQQQAANLAHWDGSVMDPAFATLKQGIANIITRGDDPAQRTRAATHAHATPKRPVWKPIAAMLLVVVLAVIGAVVWSGSDAGSLSESGATASGERQPRESTSVPGAANRMPRSVAAQALSLPAQASVTLPRERVTLTILSGMLEPVNADARLLTLHIRFSNNGTSFYRTYYSNLRLVIDDVPRAPNDPPLEQVDAASAREFDYRFDLPAAATGAVLRVMHDGQTAEIPLDVAARRR